MNIIFLSSVYCTGLKSPQLSLPTMSNEDVIITITLGSEEPLTISNGTANKEEAVTTSESKAIDGPPTIETDKETPLEVAQSKKTFSIGEEVDEITVVEKEDSLADRKLENDLVTNNAEGNSLKDKDRKQSLDENREPAELQLYERNASGEISDNY